MAHLKGGKTLTARMESTNVPGILEDEHEKKVYLGNVGDGRDQKVSDSYLVFNDNRMRQDKQDITLGKKIYVREIKNEHYVYSVRFTLFRRWNPARETKRA